MRVSISSSFIDSTCASAGRARRVPDAGQAVADFGQRKPELLPYGCTAPAPPPRQGSRGSRCPGAVRGSALLFAKRSASRLRPEAAASSPISMESPLSKALDPEAYFRVEAQGFVHSGFFCHGAFPPFPPRITCASCAPAPGIDLLVTWPFALPWTFAWVYAQLGMLHTARFARHLHPLDSTHLPPANLLGSVVVVWSIARIAAPSLPLGRLDGVARFLFAAWQGMPWHTGPARWCWGSPCSNCCLACCSGGA